MAEGGCSVASQYEAKRVITEREFDALAAATATLEEAIKLAEIIEARFDSVTIDGRNYLPRELMDRWRQRMDRVEAERVIAKRVLQPELPRPPFGANL